MLKLQQSNRQEIDMRHAYRFIQHTPSDFIDISITAE